MRRKRYVQSGAAYHVSSRMSRITAILTHARLVAFHECLWKNEREKICRVCNFGWGIYRRHEKKNQASSAIVRRKNEEREVHMIAPTELNKYLAELSRSVRRKDWEDCELSSLRCLLFNTEKHSKKKMTSPWVSSAKNNNNWRAKFFSQIKESRKSRLRKQNVCRLLLESQYPYSKHNGAWKVRRYDIYTFYICIRNLVRKPTTWTHFPWSILHIYFSSVRLLYY